MPDEIVTIVVDIEPELVPLVIEATETGDVPLVVEAIEKGDTGPVGPTGPTGPAGTGVVESIPDTIVQRGTNGEGYFSTDGSTTGLSVTTSGGGAIVSALYNSNRVLTLSASGPSSQYGTITFYTSNSPNGFLVSHATGGPYTWELPSQGGTIALTNQTVPIGGTTGQVLSKIDATNYNTQWSDVTVTGVVESVPNTIVQRGSDASVRADILISSLLIAPDAFDSNTESTLTIGDYTSLQAAYWNIQSNGSAYFGSNDFGTTALVGASDYGTGLAAYSLTGLALKAQSEGDYIADFWGPSSSALAISVSGNLVSGVGSAATGTLNLSPTLTANRTWTLPDASGTIALTGNANGSLGKLELYVKAGTAINIGQAVYITGANGGNKIIGLARANAESTSSKTLGLCAQTLANNGFGYVVTEGPITGLSIAAGTAVEGDTVWLSPTTAGGIVFGLANKPSAPNHMVFLGIIQRINGGNVTEIYVKVQNGFELEELHNVAISSPATDHIISYNSGTSLWSNSALSSKAVDLTSNQTITGQKTFTTDLSVADSASLQFFSSDFNYNGFIRPSASLISSGLWYLPTAYGTIALTSGTQTFSGAQTFSGQVELTGQAATNGTSALTRDLADKQSLFSLGVVRPLFILTGNTGTSGTGSASVNDNLGFSLTGSTTASAWQKAVFTRVLTGNPGSSAACPNYAIPMAVALTGFFYIEAAATSEIRIIIGDSNSATAPVSVGSNVLTAKGFGARIYWSAANSRREIKLFTHNGTSYNESSAAPFYAADNVVSTLQSLVISSGGDGTIKLFYTQNTTGNSGGVRTSQTALLQLSNGPTTLQSGSTFAFAAVSQVNAASSPTGSPSCKIINILLHTGVAY